MFAKIKHLAIVSQNYAMEAKFFQALFGMKVAESQRPEQRAMVVSDGYVGMNINGRAPGFCAVAGKVPHHRGNEEARE